MGWKKGGRNVRKENERVYRSSKTTRKKWIMYYRSGSSISRGTHAKDNELGK
jgi:hypothetical protein